MRISFSSLLPVILILGSAISCEKVAEIVEPTAASIDTDYYEMDFTVEAIDRTGFQIFSEQTFSIDVSSLLTQSGWDPGRIESVELKEATLRIVQTANYVDFNMLKSIELTIYTDNLGETRVAWSEPVPKDKSTVQLDASDENILPYFTEGEFILTAQGILDSRVYENVDLHARFRFRVKSEL